MILIAYSSLSEDDESRYDEMESGRSFVAMFVAGLNGLKQCKLLVPKICLYEHITFVHLFFESQDEVVTTSMLGNEDMLEQ